MPALPGTCYHGNTRHPLCPPPALGAAAPSPLHPAPSRTRNRCRVPAMPALPGTRYHGRTRHPLCPPPALGAAATGHPYTQPAAPSPLHPARCTQPQPVPGTPSPQSKIVHIMPVYYFKIVHPFMLGCAPLLCPVQYFTLPGAVFYFARCSILLCPVQYFTLPGARLYFASIYHASPQPISLSINHASPAGYIPCGYPMPYGIYTPIPYGIYPYTLWYIPLVIKRGQKIGQRL
jgi:hypothetical protein